MTQYDDTILVTGATGLVGSAIVRLLKAQGYRNVWDASHKCVDFEDIASTYWYFNECKPDYVFHCAAKVGGILDNVKGPVEFLVSNLDIQNNVMRATHKFGAKKLLFLASAACYPENAQSPLRPQDLMTGPFDETKSGYAMAKLAGIQLCKEMRKQFGSSFISVIPNNVYGPGDRSSHVVPDLIRRFHSSDLGGVVDCWGSGKARRELIFSEDLAEACLFLMDNYSGTEPVNVGVNQDWSVRELAELVADVVGWTGEIFWDTSKPEGAKQRLLDSSVLHGYGWCSKTSLRDGLAKTYDAFKSDLCQRPH